jgi:hypothetical protein
MTFKTKCTKCGGSTRLVGIEPHHKIDGADIWTFECARCGHTEIETPGLPGPTAMVTQGAQQLN